MRAYPEDVITGGVKIGKADAETGQFKPQHIGSFQGAEFTIYNDSKETICFGEEKIPAGGIVTVLRTGKDGTCSRLSRTSC